VASHPAASAQSVDKSLTAPPTSSLELTEIVYIGLLPREGFPMDERTQLRKVRHRLAVLRHAAAVSGNVSATYRYCGIRRYEEFSDERLRERSRPPQYCPHETNAEVVGKIV
jgi:hypothetical protein